MPILPKNFFLTNIMLLISYQLFWFLSSIPHSAYEEKKNNSQRFAHRIIF